MSTTDYGELIGDTLALVNVARTAFGAEPLNELPDARRGDSSDCLFYRAMDGIGVTSVGGRDMSFDSERRATYIASLWGTERVGQAVIMPEQFQRVIGAFDNGALNFYSVNDTDYEEDPDYDE